MSLPVSPSKQIIIDKINSYLQANGNITATEHKEIELLLVDAIYGAQIGDIKEIACDSTYITNNFKTGTSLTDEGLGLSTGERYGWAICNGKNGTINKMGRVAIGYDPSNFPITTAGGNTGGERNVTLNINQMPIHNHNFTTYDANDLNWANSGYNFPTGSDDNTSGRSYLNTTDIGNKGGNQAHNNMQPYIVTLFIQRIPTT
jgi:hypothetical protein